MPMDGLTISTVVHELNCRLLGAKIDKINQPEDDEIILVCRNAGESVKLLLSANAGFARVTVTNAQKANPLVAPAFCMLLRKHLTGGRILSLSQPDNERIVYISIESLNDFNEPEAKTLIIEIMGKYSNIILVNSDNTCIDAIKRVNSVMSRVRIIQPGLKYTLPPSQNKLNPFNCELPSFEPNARIICDTFTGVSKSAAEEIMFNAESVGFKRAFKEYIAEFEEKHFEPVLLIDENGEPDDFFPFPQKRFEAGRQIKEASMSEAIEAYYFLRERTQRLHERSHELRQRLNALLERSEKKRAQQDDKMRECADMEKYRIYGELLTASLYLVKKGAQSVSVPNYYDNMAMLEIPLNNTVSPSANAQKYFKQYGKLKTAARLLNRQIAETDRDIDFLTEQLENLDKCESDDDISVIRTELRDAGLLKAPKGKQKPVKSKPMHYVSDSGIDIFVGKNNTQNDELTLHFASSDDLWLHVKDAHGSHVIIKSDSPDSKTIEDGARLAVYYSKARSSSAVAVDAAKRKFVKKPSGAMPGKVIYSHQTTYYITVEQSDIKNIKRVQD